MAKPRSKNKKLDRIASELADLKEKIKKLTKAQKVLAAAITPAGTSEKPKKKPKPAAPVHKPAAPLARKRPVIVKLSDAAEAKVGGSTK